MAFKMKGHELPGPYQKKKFYGDRTRREMRQDIKEHRESLGDDKEAIKQDRIYQRGRKKELRGLELVSRGKLHKGIKRWSKGRMITNKTRDPNITEEEAM